MIHARMERKIGTYCSEEAVVFVVDTEDWKDLQIEKKEKDAAAGHAGTGAVVAVVVVVVVAAAAVVAVVVVADGAVVVAVVKCHPAFARLYSMGLKKDGM